MGKTNLMVLQFWGDQKNSEKFKNSFRREYPNHIIVRAEAAIKIATE